MMAMQMQDMPIDTLAAKKEVYEPTFMKQPPIRRYDFENNKEAYFNSREPKNYKNVLELDSTLKFMRNRVYVDSAIVNEPYNIDSDEYLQIRKQAIVNQIWDSLAKGYDLKKALTGNDLSKMINAATGLTIPFPPNPVMNLFGKPQVSINVTGEANIRVGWRWDSQNMSTVSQFGQTQSSPVFNQDIRLVVSGGIGDKLKLSTDWNTKRSFDFDNKFKIGYEGEDDDIIKLVEVGNVSLPTNSALISGSQSLFGVRADFQFGPLYLKTIASQKRGEKKIMDIKGGASKQPFSIHPYDYAKNHFFLDTAYFPIYDEYFKSSTPLIPKNPTASYNAIKNIEVWEASSDPLNNPVSARSVAYANLQGKKWKKGERYTAAEKAAFSVAGEIERGNFMKLDTTRYLVDRNLGTLTIYSMRTDRYYAVSYRIEGPTTSPDDDIDVGTLTDNADIKALDTMVLKLVYRPTLQPGFKTLWARQMKNVYSINATNVNVNDTKVNIWYYNQNNDSTDVLSDAPDKLVTIFRVDQSNNSTGQSPGDGKFDLKPPFFDTYRGELTFPSRKPFLDGIRGYFEKLGTPQLADKYIYKDVYDTTYDAARLNTARDRFVISGEVTGKSSSRITLGAMNIPPNSVKVYLDGQELKEFQDYLVDLSFGVVTLLNSRASLPNANIKIEYEQQDIFNITTKTLLGLRADYQLFKTRNVNTNLGFTIMYYDQSAVQDRVRLGDEPISNTMFGFDMKTNWDTPWLTKLLDYLPFYDTKTPSSLSVKGEWAMILPEPNKRRSEVSGDNNEPVVYLDDFEGSQRYIPLGLSPLQWTHSSQPNDPFISEDSTKRNLYRGKLQWFQYSLPRVKIKDVYPKRETYQGRESLSPMFIKFDPDIRGIYNMNPEFLDSLNPNFDRTNIFSKKPENRERIWGGFQRLLSSFTTNFDTENIEYIDVNMKVEMWEPGKTKMFIDLGQISEDVIYNGSLDTEDGITEKSPVPNNIIDPGEDLGIDALNNAKEKEKYPYPLNLEKDPARDDYWFNYGKDDDKRTEDDFGGFNNYEGNASVSESGQYPDTEILNKNNGQSLSTADGYFSYEVNLEPDANINSQIVGGNPDKGYFVYRIPIRKPSSKVGNPLFSNVQYIRVRFQGGGFKGHIVEWKLIGSYWQRINNIQSNVPSDDSTMTVSFVNVEENGSAPDYYSMPPGVKAPRQLNSDPNKEVRMNEQSLALSVRNLKYGDERMAVRNLRSTDIFYYKRMKFFVHGDGSMPEKGDVPKAYAYMRFGTDSSNYYEYKRPLYRGWQSVDIELSKLTAIKQLRDSIGTFKRLEYPADGDAGAIFAIKGNPVLTKVQFLGYGVASSALQYPNELTTTMWVDELRLLSPEDANDWSAIANADLKLADLGTVSASIRHSQPNFHRLEERFGNRMSSVDWSVSVTGNLEKFAPESFKETKIPVSYTHTEAAQDPEYVSSSDVKIEAAAQAAYRNAILQGYSVEQAKKLANDIRTRSQTVRVQDSWALQGFKFGIPVNSWLVKETVNRLTLNYSYSQDWERNPLVSQRFSWLWRFSALYSVTIPPLLTVKPLGWVDAKTPVVGNYNGWKLNFLPGAFSSSLNLTRSRITEQSRYLAYPSPVIRNFAAERQAQFNWKLSEGGILNPSIDYNFTTGSTLAPWELDANGMQRSANELTKKILFADGRIINLGQDVTHTQTFTLNLAPKLPLGDLSRAMDITGAFTTTYNWTNPMQPDPTLTDKAKNASWNNNIRFKIGFRLKSFAMGDPKSATKNPNDSSSAPSTGGFFTSMGDVAKIILADWDKLEFSVNQTSSSMNPGVFGGTGFTNFWRNSIGMDNRTIWGPNALYQLGLISNPHGGFNMVSSKKFPFFGFETYPGLRPPNAVFQENFTQKTTLEARTSRPLWKGATLDLNWTTELGYNRNQTVNTDSLGVPTFSNVLAMQSITKTYFSMPLIFGLNIFDNTAEHVIQLYKEKSNAIDNNPRLDSLSKTKAKLRALSDAFHDGLEGFSIFGGNIGKFLPAVNWKLMWEGIEKWDMWNSWVKKASIEHAYTSKYTENAQITDNGKVIQQQAVQTGFTPVIGVNVSLNEKKTDGLVTMQLKWNSTNQYSVSAANRATISRQSTEEFTLNASYTMNGFEFPLLGYIFKNDFEVSMLTSFKMNKQATYALFKEDNPSAGSTLNGNKQVVIEPRATYSISNKVKASAFFRYEGTFNEGAGTPGFSTTQIGLDLRISLSGGR
jgi:hypothetical protein